MKAIVGSLLVGALLIVGGELFRRVAALEDALSVAQEHLATQSPQGALPDDMDAVARWTVSLPLVGAPMKADLRHMRALEAYWRGDYAALATPEADGEPADAAIRFLAANAMFRDLARQPRDGQALGRGLDAVLKAYLSVLEADPAAVDAAFNYEVVSRLRGTLAAGRGNGPPLPTRSNRNGEEGKPPSQTKPSDFNIIVPLRPEERQEQTNPQGGSAPQRKG